MAVTLFDYMEQTQRLIRDVQQTDINPGDIKRYINEARVQLAGESGCIRVLGTLAVTGANRGPYAFTSVNLGSTPGVEGILNIRTVWWLAGSGQIWVEPRSFEWFSLYELNSATPDTGSPVLWSQFGQGENGSLYLGPVPSGNVTLSADCVCYPSDLTSNASVEAIARPWTTAVPYYAAYLALLSAQVGNHQAEAEKMLALYELFVKRGRQFSTPEVLSLQYAQSPIQERVRQMGVMPSGSRGDGSV